MAVISATRLHLRSKRYFLQFQIYVLRCARQVKRSPGFRGGILAGDAQGGSWTVTRWDGEAEMRAYRNSSAHRAAMPKLLNWCDEASYTHWTTDAPALPTMDEAYERVRTAGKISKVNHPSAAHVAGQTVSESRPRVGLNLRPR